MTWTTIRTFDSQAAEVTSAPASASVVDLGQYGPRCEIRLVGGAVTGSPDAVLLHVWRASGGSVDKLGTISIPPADIETPTPAIYSINERNCYVTVSFSGGTDPTLSGTVEARLVWDAVGVGGGSAIQHLATDILLAGVTETMTVTPITAIPEGAVILSARIAGNPPAAPAETRLTIMLAVGGEDVLIGYSSDAATTSLRSAGPAAVGAFGVAAAVMLEPLDELNPPDPMPTLDDVTGTVRIEITWTVP